VGASLTVVGITGFFVGGQPETGMAKPSSSAWWTAALLVVVGAAALGRLASRFRGSMGAALYATAAGLAFAFQAAVTKEFVGVVGHGLGPILSSWTTYALILSALVGFALQQSALKTGYLAPAMAASNATTLVASVALGALVFDEHIVAAGNPALPALVSFGIAVTGVIVLALPERERGRLGIATLSERSR
jgi:hypothetical protein